MSRYFETIGKPAYDEDVEGDTAKTPGSHCRWAERIREQLIKRLDVSLVAERSW